MEGWTDRPEGIACCPDSPGPVISAEIVARLNAVLPAPSGIDYFPRNELIPPKPEVEPISNVCGEQHGYSVTRTAGRSDDEVAELSRSLAAAKGKSSFGTLAGPVDSLRAYRLTQVDGQVVFIYDDPIKGDNNHAVIRVRADLSKGRVNEVREELKRTLARHIKALPLPHTPK
jgi:hypothetical protein